MEGNLAIFIPHGAVKYDGKDVVAASMDEVGMWDDRKISIAIPTYQRFEMLFESFEKVYDDERVSEIIIVDDESDKELFEKIRERCFNLPKIKLYRNAGNRDCYENKYTAISFVTNDWAILLDSDNVISKKYLDKIFSLEWDGNTSYMPSFAEPNFNYNEMAGMTLSRENIAEIIKFRMCGTMLNCSNYFVNALQYMKVWQPDIDPHTADSLLQNYNWFNAGNKMLVVPGLTYFHRVHDGSHYKQNVHKTGNLYEELIEKIKELK
jgi:glycosyltransferase involved in cell wall biosynthesis